MDDTHERDNRDDHTFFDTEGKHPAEVLADLDSADAPEVAEELAERLAEELEQPRGPEPTDPTSGGTGGFDPAAE